MFLCRGNASKPEENRGKCLTQEDRHGRLWDRATAKEVQACPQPLEPRFKNILRP